MHNCHSLSVLHNSEKDGLQQGAVARNTIRFKDWMAATAPWKKHLSWKNTQAEPPKEAST